MTPVRERERERERGGGGGRRQGTSGNTAGGGGRRAQLVGKAGERERAHLPGQLIRLRGIGSAKTSGLFPCSAMEQTSQCL